MSCCFVPRMHVPVMHVPVTCSPPRPSALLQLLHTSPAHVPPQTRGAALALCAEPGRHLTDEEYDALDDVLRGPLMDCYENGLTGPPSDDMWSALAFTFERGAERRRAGKERHGGRCGKGAPGCGVGKRGGEEARRRQSPGRLSAPMHTGLHACTMQSRPRRAASAAQPSRPAGAAAATRFTTAIRPASVPTGGTTSTRARPWRRHTAERSRPEQGMLGYKVG